jgi:predicted dehydrogenase
MGKTDAVERPIRLATVGTGGFSGAHIKSLVRLRDEGHCAVEIGAVTSRSGAGFDALRKRFGLECFTTDVDGVMADPTIDGVILCVPHEAHMPLALKALEAGKHVLVEKPMARTLAEARPMVAAARERGVVLMVGQCERFLPQMPTLKQRLAAGELGRIHSARVDAMQNASMFIPADHWYRDGVRAGGGVVMSVGIHRLDLLRYLLGDVKRVTATCRTIDPRFVNGAEDLAVATLDMVNGAVCEFYACWSAFRVRCSEGLMIYGDRGTVHAVPDEAGQFGEVRMATSATVDPEARGFMDQFAGFEPVQADPSLPTSDPVANELAHFVHCCLTGSEPVCSGRDNLRTLAVVEAIYASSREGCPVEVQQS